MAAIYALCSVTLRPFFRARTTQQTRVSGFAFSIVGDDGGLRTLFMRAVWGDPTASERRLQRLVVHRPERVRELHRDLARSWESERARYVSPGGDDYGDWFAGEFENVLSLYREASAQEQWITNDPQRLEQAVTPAGLRCLPLLHSTARDERSDVTVGVAGLLALGAVGLCAWRTRRIDARRTGDLG